MAEITREEVRRLARLARLRLADEEQETLCGQLETILGYVEQLGELDVREVEPTAHVLELATPLREDRPRPSLDPEQAVAGAPSHHASAFVVPAAIEDEDAF